MLVEDTPQLASKLYVQRDEPAGAAGRRVTVAAESRGAIGALDPFPPPTGLPGGSGSLSASPTATRGNSPPASLSGRSASLGATAARLPCRTRLSVLSTAAILKHRGSEDTE